MFENRTTRTVLYVAAAAAFISAPVIGGIQTPTVASSSALLVDDPSKTKDVAEVPPFAQDEVVFRFTPGGKALLFGDPQNVTARGLWRAGCDALPKPGSLVLVPRGALSDVRAVDVKESYKTSNLPEVKPGVPTGLYPCPVTLTTEFGVGDPTTGWLILSRAEKPQAGQDVSQSLTVFRMTRVMSPSGYLLIALSALLVTVFAWIVTAIKNKRRSLSQDGPSFADAPVSSAILGALTAVSTGAIAWSGLAPGLDLGGIVVLGLTGGVLVAVGSAIASDSPRIGNTIAVIGMALIALLLPFVLLHAATIGWSAWIPWLVVVLIVGFVVGYGPDAKPDAAAHGSGQRVGGRRNG